MESHVAYIVQWTASPETLDGLDVGEEYWINYCQAASDVALPVVLKELRDKTAELGYNQRYRAVKRTLTEEVLDL